MPNDSDDAQVRIGAFIDPAGATAGAAQVVKDVDAIEESTGKASEGAKNLVDNLGSLRSAHHAIAGIGEIARGGTAELAGMAMEARFVTEAFEAMIPGAGPLLAVLTGLTIGLGMLSRSQESAEKATDKATEAQDKQADSIKALETQAAASYPNILKYLQAVSKEMNDQLSATRSLQRAQQELEDAQVSGQLAELDQSEDADMEGKDADQRAAIKRDYDKRRLAVKQQLAKDKAAAEVTDKQSALDEANSALTENQKEVGSVGQGLQQAYAVVNGGGAKGLADAGVKSDAQAAADRLEQLRNLNNQLDSTGALRGLSPDEQKEYDSLSASIAKLKEDEQRNGPSLDAQLKALQAKKDESDKEVAKDTDPSFWHGDTIADPDLLIHNQERAEKAKQESAATQLQIDAILKYQTDMKAAQAYITDNVTKFRELNAATDVLTKKIKDAADGVATAQQKQNNLVITQQTETSKLNSSAKDEQAQRDYENREAARKAQQDALDAQIKATNDETLKGVLEKQKAALEGAGIEDKAKVDLSSGKIGKAQYDEAMARVSEVQTNASTQVASQNRAAAQKDAKQVGNDAEADIKALGGSKQQAQEAHAAVQELDKGSAQGVQMLEGILTQLVGTTKNLTDGQKALFQNLMSRLQEVERTLNQHAGAINSLTRGTHAS